MYPQHLPAGAGVGVMVFDSPPEAAVISPIGTLDGNVLTIATISLASSSSEYCPGVWPVSWD